MNENINLCEILRDCPKGTKFYSLVHGEVTFMSISKKSKDYPIEIRLIGGLFYSYTSGGKMDKFYKGECILLPSKDQRDWSKLTAPWYKKEESIKPKFKVGDRIRHKETNKDDVYEISKVYDDSYGIVGFNWGIYMKYQDQYELVPNKFDPKTLKPFDKVLCWNGNDCIWECDFFSYYKKDRLHPCVCVNGSYIAVIPYNNKTEHFAGTSKIAPVFYRYWED